MTSRHFLNEQEFRNAGFSEPTINLFRKLATFVDTQAQLTTAQGAINANADSIAELAANDAIFDARLAAYDLLAPFVREDHAAAPAYTPYAGQTVSLVYTQAEAQATDDAVKALATAYDALVTALQLVRLLT